MNLQLKLVLPTEPVISGAVLSVKTTVQNTGNAPVDLPPAKTLSPLTFTVLDASGRTIATGGALDAVSSRLGVPGPKPPPQPLAPGAEVVYQEEISSYFGRPLPAGKYQLEATVRVQGAVLGSTRAPLEVLALTPESALRVSDANGSVLTTLAAHKRPDGKRILFYSQMQAQGGPPPTLRPVLELGAGQPTALALCPRVFTEIGGVWVATQDGEACRGILARSFDATAAFGPVALRPGAKLLETGVPLPDGGAVFVAFGQESGKPILTLINVSPKGETSVQYVSLGSSAPTKPPVLAVSLEGGSPRVYAVWIEGASVMASSFSPASPPLDAAPAKIHDLPNRVLAFQPAPAMPEEPAKLDLILAPTADEEPPLYSRLTLGSSERPGVAPLPPLPKGSIARNVALWLLPIAGGSPTGPMVISIGNSAWLLTDGTWQALSVSLRSSQGTQLVRYANRPWLSTWSPQTGLSLEAAKP